MRRRMEPTKIDLDKVCLDGDDDNVEDDDDDGSAKTPPALALGPSPRTSTSSRSRGRRSTTTSKSTLTPATTTITQKSGPRTAALHRGDRRHGNRRRGGGGGGIKNHRFRRRHRRSGDGGGGGDGGSSSSSNNNNNNNSNSGRRYDDERSRDGGDSGRTAYSSGGLRSTLDVDNDSSDDDGDDDDPTADHNDDSESGRGRDDDDNDESGEDSAVDDDDDESSSLQTGFMTNLGRGVMELERTVAGMITGMPRRDDDDDDDDEEEEELQRMMEAYDENFFNDTSSFNSQDRRFFQDLSGPEGEEDDISSVDLRRQSLVRGRPATPQELAEAVVGEAVEDDIDEEQQSTAHSWTSSWLKLGRSIPAAKPNNDDPSSVSPLPNAPSATKTTRIIVESKSSPNQDPVLRLGDISFTSSDSNSREVLPLIRDVSMVNGETSLQSRKQMEAEETVMEDDGGEDQNTEVDVQEFRRVTSLMGQQQPARTSKEGDEVQQTQSFDPPTQHHGLTRSLSFISTRKPSSNRHKISPLPSDPGATTLQTNANSNNNMIHFVRSRSWMGRVTTKPLKPPAGSETTIMRDKNSPRSSPFSLRKVDSKLSRSSRGSLPSMSPRPTPVVSPTTSEVELVVDHSRLTSDAPPASLDLPVFNKNYPSKSREKKEVQASFKQASDVNRSNDASNDSSLFDEAMPRMVLSTTTRAATIEPRAMNVTERPPPLTHIVLSHHSKVDTITPNDIIDHDQELPPPTLPPIALVHTPMSALSTNESIEYGTDDWTLATTEEKEPRRRGIGRSFSWFGRSKRSKKQQKGQDHLRDDSSSLPETLHQKLQEHCIEPSTVISLNESIEFSYEEAKMSFADRRKGCEMRGKSNAKPIRRSSSHASEELVHMSPSVPCEKPLKNEFEPALERGKRQGKQKKVRVKKEKRTTGTNSQTVSTSRSAKDSEQQCASSTKSKATTKREDDATLSLLPPLLSELRAAKSINKPSGSLTFRKVKRSLSCSRRRPTDDPPSEARAATNHSVEIVGLPEKRKLWSSRVDPFRTKEPKKSKSFKGIKNEKSAEPIINESQNAANAAQLPLADRAGLSFAPATEIEARPDPPASDVVWSSFGESMTLDNFVQTAKEAVVGVQESVVQTAQDTVVGVQDTVAGVIDDPFAEKMKSTQVVERNNQRNKKDVHMPRRSSVSTSQRCVSMVTMDGGVTKYKAEQEPPPRDKDALATSSTAFHTERRPYEPPSFSNWQSGKFQPASAVQLQAPQIDKVKTTRAFGWLARKKIQEHAKRGSILFSQKGREEEDQRRRSHGGGGNPRIPTSRKDSPHHHAKSSLPPKQAFPNNGQQLDGTFTSHSDDPIPMVRISVETW